MALRRKRADEQQFLFVPYTATRSPGHPFYEKLNTLLREAQFDRFAEDLCAPHYADGVGRPGIVPGVYFRMLLIGYFEGIDSQRGIAWRCADSRSLGEFLGLRPDEATPDHSSLTRIRKRLPLSAHEAIFERILSIAREKGLLKGKTIAVDSTTLEANAAMKSIVRKDSGEDWKEYVTRLAKEAGIENPTDEELRRFDRKRQGKKCSNDDWRSPSDPDARIAKMKNGDTHLAYKAEHAVDLDTEMIVAAEVYHADESDGETLATTLGAAQVNLTEAGAERTVDEAVADKGYHASETLVECAESDVRTYIPDRKTDRRIWTDKPAGQREAVYANRRRCRGERGKRLQRLRSERVERSFAHVCETGGARRSWIRGLWEVSKRYLMQVAGHNLGILMRKLFGIGTPRSLQGSLRALVQLFEHLAGLVRDHMAHQDDLCLRTFPEVSHLAAGTLLAAA